MSVAGGKSWRFDYDFFGKRKTLTIGVYPNVRQFGDPNFYWALRAYQLYSKVSHGTP
ncbi:MULTISPECIES: Arm DNA-binding domain-containing protein [Rhizobium/Agrobacterium group]|uniref:Arm DNA-binding domain-containing protein n=1 Tax=Rhizobium/Agrobacterium group TaxID=227290 RepID=UPI001E499A2B|nr:MULTISPECIES: Arm DNA-binding domain-containing protein [Rhizobium/Agrobacterium group]